MLLSGWSFRWHPCKSLFRVPNAPRVLHTGDFTSRSTNPLVITLHTLCPCVLSEVRAAGIPSMVRYLAFGMGLDQCGAGEWHRWCSGSVEETTERGAFALLQKVIVCDLESVACVGQTFAGDWDAVRQSGRRDSWDIWVAKWAGGAGAGEGGAGDGAGIGA